MSFLTDMFAFCFSSAGVFASPRGYERLIVSEVRLQVFENTVEGREGGGRAGRRAEGRNGERERGR